MVRLRLISCLGFVALALCASQTGIAQTTGGLSAKLDAAEKKLDADIKACRAINVNDYLSLQNQASANFYKAEKALKSGAPVNTQQVADDSERATRLVERAQSAAAKQAEACKPPNQSVTSGPAPNPPPPPPPPPPQPMTPSATGGPPPPPPPPPPPQPPTWPSGEPVSAQDFLAGAEDEAEDSFDDFVDAAMHCDAKGMQEALDELKTLESQAESIMQGAEMAGKYSKVSAGRAEDVLYYIRDVIRDTANVKMRCPLIPKLPLLQTPLSPCKPEQPKAGAQSQSMVPLDRTSQSLLDYHNELRSYVGMPPLHWDPILAEHAQTYATTLSETGQLQHSARQGRENERENIAVGPRGSGSPMSMMMIWGGELQYFHPGKFPDACNGDWSRCGHITQILWGRTTSVGCGFASGRFDALVCRYSPPGNQDGGHVLQLPRGWPCGSQLPRTPSASTRPERGR